MCWGCVPDYIFFILFYFFTNFLLLIEIFSVIERFKFSICIVNHKVMKKIGNFLRIVVEKLVGGIIMILLYLPIILGILAPMLVVMGLDLYISWYILGNSFMAWTWYYYLIPSGLLPFYIFIEITILCFGLGLFFTSFFTFVREKIHGAKLVRSGIYKYIRHPQNLGIVILALPFSLYVPGFRDIGIRMGEIASWMFFTFFICLYSYYEEWRLLVRYNGLFSDYYNTTGFMTPKIFRGREKPLTLRRIVLKIGIFFVSFVLLFVLFYLVVITSENHLMLYR